MGRRLGSDLLGVHGVLPPVDEPGIEGVLHPGRPVGNADEALGVRLVLGEEQLRRALGVEEALAEARLRGADHEVAGAGGELSQARARRIASPRPGIAEPKRREQVERCLLRAAIVHADLDQEVFWAGLRVLDEHIEVAILIEDTGVEQLVLEVLPAPATVGRDQLVVGVRRLRVLVEVLHERVGRRRIQVEVVLLDVLAVVALAVGETEEALLENGVLAIPQGEREAEQLTVVGDSREAVLTPAVGPRARVVVAEIAPGIARLAVVLAHRAPLSFAQVGAPAPPGLLALPCLLQALALDVHVPVLPRLEVDPVRDSCAPTLATVCGSWSDDDSTKTLRVKLMRAMALATPRLSRCGGMGQRCEACQAAARAIGAPAAGVSSLAHPVPAGARREAPGALARLARADHLEAEARLVAQRVVEREAPTARTTSAGRCAGSAAGRRASSWASATASASARPFGTSRFARPIARASSPRTPRPVRIRSSAWLWPIRRGRRIVPPSTERHAPAPAVDAEDRVLRRHAQVAPERELEAAGDGVALDGGDHGLGEQHPRRPHRPVAGLLRRGCRAPRPARAGRRPAQKVPPAPVSTATERSGSASKRRKASAQRGGGRSVDGVAHAPGARASRSRRGRRVSLRTPLMRASPSRARAPRARPRACA